MVGVGSGPRAEEVAVIRAACGERRRGEKEAEGEAEEAVIRGNRR